MSANPYRDEPGHERPRDDQSELEKKIIETAKVAVPVGTVVIASIAGAVLGAPATVLVLAGGALIAVIAVFWASVRTLLGETALSGADAYALGAPRAEEEQKRAVLRALKDLEFERSVGKISEEDYQALVAKYRAEAKRLLRMLDAEAQPRREQVEALVQKRLRRAGLLETESAPEDAAPRDAEAGEDAQPAPVEEDKAPAAPARPKKRKKARVKPPEEAEADDRACASCGTINDMDAVFCKKCGARRAAVKADAPGEEEGAS